MKKRFLFLSLILAALLSIFAIGAFAEQEAPALKIEAANLEFADNVYLWYAVSHEGISAEDVELLFFYEPKAAYTKENADGRGTLIDSEATVLNTDDCMIFKNDTLRAKNMADDIYAVAYAEVDGEEYYSAPIKYSILQYAYNKLGITGTASENEALKNALASMLEYGASIQLYTGYRTDRLANANFYQVSVSGGTLSDGFDCGLFAEGERISLSAPAEKNGQAFAAWVNAAGRRVATTADATISATAKNEIYTAIYGEELFVAYDDQGLGYILSEDETHYIVYGVAENAPTDITIPYTFADLPVQSIREKAFYQSSTLTSVTLPSIRTIGAEAFYECESLAYIVFSSNLATVDSGAFYGCESFRSRYFTSTYFHYLNMTAMWTNVDFNCGTADTPRYPTTYMYSATNTAEENNEGGQIWQGSFWHYVDGEIAIWQDPPAPAVKYSEGLSFVSKGNGTCYVNGIGSCTDTSIVLPRYSPDGDRVIGIANYAFANCSTVTEVLLCKEIESIGDYAFRNCVALSAIEIPGNVKTIGKFCFSGCINLREVEFNEGLDYIQPGAFAKCPIENLVIPNSVTKIESTYRETSYIKTVGAFTECKNLKSLIIGDGLGYIDTETFKDCEDLKTVIIGATVQYIGNSAFANCVSLQSATIGNGTERIYPYAFLNCYKLTDVSIGSAVEALGDYAFQNCVALSAIEIPGNVKTIGKFCFSGCINLCEVEFNEGLDYIQPGAFTECPIESLVIPNSVTKIESTYQESSDIKTAGAFMGCKNLKNVIVGNNVEYIDTETFKNCEALQTVVIASERTKSIRISAFENCYSLESITTGNRVERIYPYAFSNCYKLTDISIGSMVEALGDYAFQNCKSLTEIVIPCNVKTIEKYCFVGCESLRNVELSEGLDHIYPGAFMECPIESLVIPNSVTKIDGTYQESSYIKTAGAFAGCKKLIRVVMGDGLEYIGAEAFKNCTVLNDVTIGPNVKSIHEGAFSYCFALTSICIPSKVTSIGTHAFEECFNLTDIHIGNQVKTISSYAFSKCSTLKRIYIPGNVNNVGSYAFANCVMLKEILIGVGNEYLREFGENVFSGTDRARIYYMGTPEDWKPVTADTKNTYPLPDPPFYYSEEDPNTTGNYWHYNSDGVIVIWNLAKDSFVAEQYADRYIDGFWGDAGTSYAYTLYEDLKNNDMYQLRINSWEALNLVTETSWDSKLISKKDLYKSLLYDLMMYGEDKEEEQKSLFSALTDSYSYEVVSFIFENDDNYDLLDLKDVFPSEECFKKLQEHFKIVDHVATGMKFAESMYDVAIMLSQYLALADMDAHFHSILNEIAEDSLLPLDLRLAAEEVAQLYQMSIKDIQQQVLKGELLEATFIFAVDEITKRVTGVFIRYVATSICPQLWAVELIADGLIATVDGVFNLSAKNEAYYHLEASIGIETAMRNIINRPANDYFRVENITGADRYLYSIDVYEKSVLMSFDSAITLLNEEASGADSMFEQDEYQDLIDFATTSKESREQSFINFENIVNEEYQTLYPEEAANS